MKKNKAFSLVELSVVILIIGILVAGVTQSGRLIRQIKLSTARSVTASSDVASIRDVTAWFEASTDGVFTDTNNVTDIENKATIVEWRDINPQKPIGDRPTLRNEGSGSQPMYVANGINGIPSVYFKEDDFIYSTIAPTMPLLSKDKTYSMFAVFRTDLEKSKTKSIITQIGSGTTLANNQYASIGFIGSGTNSGKPGFITNATENNNWIQDTRISDQTDYIVGVLADLTATTVAQSSVTLYVNSLTAVTGFPTGGTYAKTEIDAAKFSIGASAAGTSADFFNGMVSEVIIFDRKLKDEEAQSVMKYLRKKYNVNS
jgi:prepilin-type N-terminal cleavage/methylation domain-containing protein